MEVRKTHDGGMESSIYNSLFYHQSNRSELSVTNSSSKLRSFCNSEDNMKDINQILADSTHADNKHKDEDLKESTRKLLTLLEQISCETRSVHQSNNEISCVSKPKSCRADGEECTIYNRLTRKCQCLNNSVYNDFILHFNEHIKHSTCDVGEIIKNMRIVKRFLYMGDGYTRNALLFLREALTQSSICDKSDILQGCIHADICNIFEDHSVVTTFIIWPCKYRTSGDFMTQMLTGVLLYKIANTKEGNRYLNLNSKIAYDIKHALKKHSTKLNKETVESLSTTLNLLEQYFAKHDNISSCAKRTSKGIEKQTVVNLIKCRQQMTISEVALNLEILNNCSKQRQGKLDLTENLPQLLLLLKNILRDCDSSEINIIATSILNNVISKNIIDGKESEENNKITVVSTATEPIEMKSELIQMNGKKIKKQKCKAEDLLWDSFVMEKSKKACDKTRKQAIIVPADN